MVDAGKDLVERRQGQFLQQDYRTGNWRQLNSEETQDYIRFHMLVGRRTLWEAIAQDIKFMFDFFRFGVPSRTRIAMARCSQRFLEDLGRKLFSTWPTRKTKSKVLLSSWVDKDDHHRSAPLFLPHSALIGLPTHHLDEKRGLRNRGNSPVFRLFDEVEYRTPEWENKFFVGTIVGVNPTGGYNVAFYCRSLRKMEPVGYAIPAQMLQKRFRVVEGGRVRGNFRNQGVLFPGKVMMAWPDGAVDILYDDNDAEESIMPGMYRMELNN